MDIKNKMPSLVGLDKAITRTKGLSGISGDMTMAEALNYCCDTIESLRLQIAEHSIQDKRDAPPVPYYALVYALVLMSNQYLTKLDGTLDHQFMWAGEAALEVLERLGLCTGEFGVMLDNADEEDWLREKFAAC